MSVEMAAFGVGRSVVQLAVGRWLAGRSARQEMSRDLVDLVKVGFSDELRRRRAERQLEDIADSVTERILKLARHEYSGLTDGDRLAAIDEVTRTLKDADLSDDALFATDVDPVKLSRTLRSRLSARQVEFELGDAGARFYEVALDECCDCLARIIVHLPQFVPRASAETLSRLSSLADKVNTVLSRLPARSLTAPEGEADDGEFTRRYLASISETLDTLELLGVRFERFTRPQTTLSVAYISLNVSNESHRTRQARLQAVPIDDWRDEDRASGAVRVESALHGHRLMLLRGEAGSGKSTILRWLAVTAARGAFTGPLSEWNGSVPFVIKLRSHAGGPLPRPEEFIDDVAGNLAGIMPRGWVHRRLTSGRSLLLVDGVDEVTATQRHAVRQWLKGIVNDFRDIRIVVTSRPAAASSDWLRAEGFATAFLEQLAPADVRSLVHHWHNAVRDCADLPCAPERLPSYEARLLARLEAAAHLRTLASSPLLAAMLCALNMDREELPRNRIGLYRAALDMLLENRDAKRGIPSLLERDQKIRFLQDIAWHLSTSSRVELPKPMVERLIADRLTSMPQISAGAAEVLDQLLQRSGVIREPALGRIDFVHRTVQEYLAAKQAADLGDMELLIQNAHRDTWRETVIMAAGHANEPLRRELVSGILDRTRSEPRRARNLKLVAVACLETLPSIPNDLRTDLDRCLDDLVPPRNKASARSLAIAGAPVLARLPAHLEHLSDAAAIAAIQTAWLVNGPEALTVLSRFAHDSRPAVQHELIQAWDYFDPQEFAERVLATVVTTGGQIQVWRSAEKLAALRVLPPLSYLYAIIKEPMGFDFLNRHVETLTDLTLMFDVAGANPADLPTLPNLESLVLGVPGMSDLTFLDNLPELKGIWLPRCEDVVDFGPVKRHTNLQALALHGSHNLTDLRALPSLGSVRHLGLNGSGLTCGLAELADAAPNTEVLFLDDCNWVDDLAVLGSLPLRQLELNGCTQLEDVGPLADLSSLGVLSLSRTSVRDLTPLAVLSGLHSIRLNGCPHVSDLRPLASLRNLRALSIRDVRPDIDLSPLAGNRKLTVYISAGQKVRGDKAFRRRIEIL